MIRPDTARVRRKAEKQGIPTARGERQLVWHDEFTDKADFDRNWKFRRQMASTDVRLMTDERHLDYVDNELVMNAYRADGTDGIDFTIPLALTTYDKMVFKRGYLEMRAKMPFRHGAWPSLWMLTYDPLQESPIRSEIDIFEIFSSPDQVVCNLHKTRREADGKIYARDSIGGKMVSERRFTYPHPENLNDEYHIYGMEWTDKDISFYVDDEKYTTIPLNEEYSDTLRGMDCYQDFHFVILCDYVFTPGHHWAPEGYLIKPEDPSPVTYKVDWIRLYQKPGEEILVGE